MSRTQTKIEEEMEAQLAQLPPDSFRYGVLLNARKFKSNWLDLGEQLHQVLKNKDYEKWGYSGFETYCKNELKLKFDTVMKLIASFGYLKKHKPTLVQEPRQSPIPDYKGIHQLVEAEETGDIPQEKFQELRNQVLSSSLSPLSVKKQLQVLRNEDPKEMQRIRHLERLSHSSATLKKLLPQFNPSTEAEEALTTLDTFISQISPSEQ